MQKTLLQIREQWKKGLAGLGFMPRSDKDVVYVRARVPKDIHLRFKIASLRDGKDMDKIINELIVARLDENESKQEAS